MLKLLFFFLIPFSLVAQSISFKEERYIEALDNSVFKKGHIELTTQYIDIKYSHNKRTYRYENGNVYTLVNNEKKQISKEKSMVLTIFFSLVKSIYANETKELENFFIIKKTSEEILLKPKKDIRPFISKIIYRKKEKLDYLKIYLPNNDWINIEQTY